MRRAAQLVASALRAAVEERLIAHNPAERLPLPRVENTAMKFLTPAEVARLAAAIDERYRVWVLTAAYSGLRLGELTALRAGDIDLTRCRIEVHRTASEVRGQMYEGPPKTRAGRRAVPIPTPVTDALRGLCGTRCADDLVFPSPEGQHLRAGLFRSRFFQPAAVDAGLGEFYPGANGKRRYRGLRIHDLRHTAVTFRIAAVRTPTRSQRGPDMPRCRRCWTVTATRCPARKIG